MLSYLLYQRPTAIAHATSSARAAKPATKPNNKDRATMKMNIIMAIYTDLHHNGSARRLIFTLAMVSSAFGALNLIGNQRQMIGRPPPAPTSLALAQQLTTYFSSSSAFCPDSSNQVPPYPVGISAKILHGTPSPCSMIRIGVLP